MDEQSIRDAVRWLLIRERAVEHDLTETYFASLVRYAYALGYMSALEDPSANLEQAARTTSALYCRLPV